MNEAKTAALTTQRAVDTIAYERAPRYPGRTVNKRVVCADGFAVSVQASAMHYANDSSGSAPYWQLDDDPPPDYPFVTFERGNADTTDLDVLAEWDSGGVWAWVPRDVVIDLLDSHGARRGRPWRDTRE